MAEDGLALMGGRASTSPSHANAAIAAAVALIIIGGTTAQAWHGIAYTGLAIIAGAKHVATALGLGKTFVFVIYFLTPLAVPLILEVSAWKGVGLIAARAAVLAFVLSRGQLPSRRSSDGRLAGVGYLPMKKAPLGAWFSSMVGGAGVIHDASADAASRLLKHLYPSPTHKAQRACSGRGARDILGIVRLANRGRTRHVGEEDRYDAPFFGHLLGRGALGRRSGGREYVASVLMSTVKASICARRRFVP